MGTSAQRLVYIFKSIIKMPCIFTRFMQHIDNFSIQHTHFSVFHKISPEETDLLVFASWITNNWQKVCYLHFLLLDTS